MHEGRVPDVLPPFQHQEENMKVISINEAPKEPFTHPAFKGTDVTGQVLAPDTRESRVNMVNCGKGVQNKYHAHDREQILIVVTGKGIVSTERDEWIVNEGDVIFIPPGVPHWRGASTHVEFSHIFVSPSDSLGDGRED
jgi:quercetin dioxygenase-like cupin family protein